MNTANLLDKFLRFLVRKRLKIRFIIIALILILNLIHQKSPNNIFVPSSGMLGAILTIFGILLRTWAADVIIKNEKLTVSGPYTLFRHPLYIGSFLMALGYCFILGDWYLFILLFLMVVGIYLPKIREEEHKLSEKFPEEWNSFCSNTAIFFQKSIPKKLKVTWSFNQWLHNKEYNAFFTGLLALIVLFLW